jgi:hypothetical protein
MTTRRTVLCLLAAFVVAALAPMTLAADKPSPEGTWKWTVSRNNQDMTFTLKLKLEGDKLTGTITAGTRDTAITEGKFADGAVTFSVVREGQNGKMTTKYEGKLDGDTIKGKITSDRANAQPRDWEAKREK